MALVSLWGCDDATLSNGTPVGEAVGDAAQATEDLGWDGAPNDLGEGGADARVGGGDAAQRDAVTRDGEPRDGEPRDGAPRDGADLDGSVDTTGVDGRAPDAVIFDAAIFDLEVPDAEVPDAEVPDAQWRCDPLPAQCGGAQPAVVEHRMVAADGCVFALVPEDDEAAAVARADELVALTGRRYDLTDVLDDLNRVGQPGITAGAADRLRNHPFEGLRFNAGDQTTAAWYPQGLTGADDAWPGGHPRRLLLVSWYDHDDPETTADDDDPVKGVRLSLVDATDLAAPRYRHLLLVETRGSGATLNFDPVTVSGMGDGGPLHAGGIVWAHPWLYVADTTRGFRVFDLSRVARVPDVDADDRVGISAGRIDAFSYRYVVPQVARYRPAPGTCPVRFSFAGLDRSADPPVIVSGEYIADAMNGRLVSWPLNPDTGRFVLEPDGTVRGVDAVVGGQTRMQGGLSYDGDYYLSSSSQVNGLGRLYRTRPGLESRITAWPRGCEDLYMERSTDLIWTVTEHPDEREVVGIPRLVP